MGVFLPLVMQNGPTVVSTAGDDQTATVGTALAVTPTVRVVDAQGQPVSGTPIDFVVTSGDGHVTGAHQLTDAAGTASPGAWILGTKAGINTLDVVYAGGPALSFRATGIPGPATALLSEAGDDGSAPVGGARQLAARVVDGYDNVIAGHTVAWTAAAGGGTLSAPSSTTDAAGVATVTWTLGPVAGSQSVTATSGAAPGLSLTYTVLAVTSGASPAASPLNASPEAITADGVSTAAITLRLKDASGNDLTTSGGAVTMGTSSGTLGPVTDHQDGTYSATLTAPTTAGQATITATLAAAQVADTATVSFLAGPAARRRTWT